MLTEGRTHTVTEFCALTIIHDRKLSGIELAKIGENDI